MSETYSNSKCPEFQFLLSPYIPLPRERAGVRAACRVAIALAALAVPARAAPPCGTIVIPVGIGQGNPNAVTGLNPMIGSSLYNTEIQNVIYRPLIWVAADGTIDWRLSVAQSIDVSADGLTYHIAMKPWLWSDGVPITADDVAYNLELIRAMGDTYAGKGTADMPDIIAKLTVTGPLSLDVTLTHKVSRNGFTLNGLAQLVPLPRHAWGKTPVDEMWRRQTDLGFFQVVSGPYRVTKFAIGRFLVMQANPAYSGSPEPHVEKIVDNFLEGVAPLQAMQGGEIDASNIPYSVWGPATALPGFHAVSPDPAFGYYYLALNYVNPSVSFFRDVRVRQAMADAIDQKQIVSLVYHGHAQVNYSPTAPALAGLLSPADKAGRWPVGYDPARARALLDAAGWRPGPDGVRVKDGKRLSFGLLISSGQDQTTEENEVIQRDFAAVGIEMKVSELTFPQLLSIAYGPSDGWQAFYIGTSGTAWPDPLPQFGTGGTENREHYSDPAMDALGKRIDLEDGPAAAQQYNDFSAEQQPVIFLPRNTDVMLARDGISGFRAMLNPSGLWAPEFLRLSGPMACHAEAHRAS